MIEYTPKRLNFKHKKKISETNNALKISMIGHLKLKTSRPK